MYFSALDWHDLLRNSIKYMLRRKLFNPQFTPAMMEDEFYDAFIRDVAVVKDKTATKESITKYRHFLTNSVGDSGRKGFRLRCEAISYYNMLVQKADGDAHIRYNAVNSATKNIDMLELAVSHMETVMTGRCKQTLEGVRKITDFEAQDLSNILNAIHLENLLQLDLPELLPAGHNDVLPDLPAPATVDQDHQTPPGSGSGRSRGITSISSMAIGSAGEFYSRIFFHLVAVLQLFTLC